MDNKIEFETYLENLFYEIQKVDSYLELHILLKNRQIDYLAEMNLSPSFFQLAIQSFLHSAIISLARVYEGYVNLKRSDRCICKFLNFVENNLTLFSESKNEQTINFELIEMHRKQILDHSNTLICLFKWRDKGIAHFDKKYFGKSDEILVDCKITYGQIRDLIKLCANILNTYSSGYSGHVTHYRMSNFDDVNIILNKLKKLNECM